MRSIAIVAICAMLIVVSSCKSQRKEESQSQVSELQEQLDDVRSQLAEAESNVETLKGNVSDPRIGSRRIQQRELARSYWT